MSPRWLTLGKEGADLMPLVTCASVSIAWHAHLYRKLFARILTTNGKDTSAAGEKYDKFYLGQNLLVIVSWESVPFGDLQNPSLLGIQKVEWK